MAVYYGGRYTGVSDIRGPSGFYNIILNGEMVPVYVDQNYDGGGWICVLANRINTAGLNNLTYYDAVNTCNYRTGGTANGTNTSIPATSKLSGLANYNIWIGLKYWSLLSGRATVNTITIVQFVSSTVGAALSSTGLHAKRYRWRINSFNGTYGMTGATAVSDETGTGIPGFYSYHAANSFGLTAYDRDQDTNGGNCATYYNNNPWWYGSCWDGNYFAGGSGYADAPNWASAGSDVHNYGAVYIK